MELEALKASSAAVQYRSKLAQEKRRNLLVLIMRHLADQGYVRSVQALREETSVSLTAFDVADNMDLATIVQVRHETWALVLSSHCCKLRLPSCPGHA